VSLAEKTGKQAPDPSATAWWMACMFGVLTILPLAFYRAMIWMMWTPVIMFMCDDVSSGAECGVRLLRLYAPCLLFAGSCTACTMLIALGGLRLSVWLSMAFCLTSWIVSPGPVHQFLFGPGF